MADSMFTWGTHWWVQDPAGKEPPQKIVSSAKRSKEQVDKGWRGKLGGSSPQELHKQLLGSIAFSSKIFISGITDCETT